MINIKNADKAEVLAALYNHSRILGFGTIQARYTSMTVEQAREEIDNPIGDGGFQRRPGYFDYLHGRVMKVYIDRDELDPCLYDRDNGRGAAAEALKNVKGVIL